MTDQNVETYNRREIVAYYASATELQPCERALFERWLKPGLSILDVGMGGGRTTVHLSPGSARYVGIDYSLAMVDSCRRRFPQLDFRHCDASDLSQFGDGEFDVAVFSFNGIDHIRNDESRANCLGEVARTLKGGGVFIFSSHNAKALGVWPKLKAAQGTKIPWRILYSLVSTLRLAPRALASDAFWRGCGYVVDPVHGGLIMYTSIPATMEPQLRAAGFEIVEVLGGGYPDTKLLYFTPWHYYACRKLGAA